MWAGTPPTSWSRSNSSCYASSSPVANKAPRKQLCVFVEHAPLLYLRPAPSHYCSYWQDYGIDETTTAASTGHPCHSPPSLSGGLEVDPRITFAPSWQPIWRPRRRGEGEHPRDDPIGVSFSFYLSSACAPGATPLIEIRIDPITGFLLRKISGIFSTFHSVPADPRGTLGVILFSHPCHQPASWPVPVGGSPGYPVIIGDSSLTRCAVAPYSFPPTLRSNHLPPCLHRSSRIHNESGQEAEVGLDCVFLANEGVTGAARVLFQNSGHCVGGLVDGQDP